MMLPPDVDQAWYDGYWYGAKPRPRRRAFSGSLARFAIIVSLVLAFGTLASRFRHTEVVIAARSLMGQWTYLNLPARAGHDLALAPPPYP
jgi:hypothetical protein